jgi:hypothetical protein
MLTSLLSPSLLLLLLLLQLFLYVAPEASDRHPPTVFISVLVRNKAGLPIKNPHKKTNVKNPLKMGFLGFFKFLIFYENNTNFSL